MAEAAAPSVLLAVEQLRRRVPGGIGSYARGLLEGLAVAEAEGDAVDVALLASRAPRGEDDPLAELGRPLHTSRLPSALLTRAWDHGLSRAPAGFDVVHSVSLASPQLQHASPERLVVTVHDVAWRRHPEATTRRGVRWHEAALRRASHSGAALVVPSRLVAADLAESGVAEGRITVVPSGADHLPPPDPAATDALLRRVGVSGPYLLTVSTLEPRKNVDRLVRAFGRVRAALPGPWPLVIVGPSGWGPVPAVPGADDHVVFTGSVPAAVLSELYRRARAFAYVPLTEGYGLPPLEAMHAGIPTVVSDEVPSVHDLGALDTAPARIVDPLDVDSIAAGLADVLTDEAQRAELARQGAAYAATRTWRSTARAHLDLWRSLR
ncbi:MAG TPA: glycosyltransferase family 1 protein [Acidimicrobiales bacterium]|nr:glycosyltransferase family 1 protein [Acidimicrobiales bacterium]